jgi:hypothetical protein
MSENIKPNTYEGKQVIINSDRLVFNARNDAILLYSNEQIGFSTNGNFHFNTSNLPENKFIINAPNIYLGLNREGLPYSPAVKGHELGVYLGGTGGLLETLEQMIDVITGQLTFISPSPYGPVTSPNVKNEAKFSKVLGRISDLKKEVNNFKSNITKVA